MLTQSQTSLAQRCIKSFSTSYEMNAISVESKGLDVF